ncbi:TPA: hypothetical protein ACRR44_004512, partial [Klebsiella quasipneumoniae]
PRLACALNEPLFVHLVQVTQAPPVLAPQGENGDSEIVQICATFCLLKSLVDCVSSVDLCHKINLFSCQSLLNIS